MTDPISRASVTMARCTKAIQELAISDAEKDKIEGVHR